MDTITGLRHSMSPIFRQYNIRKAILFGSLARGEETQHSDVDLILIQETQKRFWDRYDGLLLALGQAARQYAVDALIYTPKELEAIKERTFIRQALKEGITLYESE
ncbi:MAG: hypothetical protein CO064_10640 [Anaerolineae bacterium CG_4_9_14_0_8_um_filter_58_9]|nr:MAG: hypothetical protein CO064_10640 [Anaerolineae bacterium CG_4_9_14_0_8_um_filter_58_9]